MAAELLCVFPASSASLAPLTHVRSTLLASSLHALKKRDLAARYWALLPKEHHETLESIVPGMWLHVDVALAHYRACDALGLADAEIRDLGADVGGQVNQSVLQTITKLAMTVGATPWTALVMGDRFAARMWQGSGVEVWRLGPKEARVVFKLHTLMGVTYFRVGLCALMKALATPLARTSFSRLEVNRDPIQETRIRLSWA